MKPTQKYLHAMRAVWIRDTEELSDADLDAMLGATGSAADPAKRNPNPLTATGLSDLLGAVIERSNRRLVAAAEVFGLDLERLRRIAEAEEQDGAVDRVTANMVALEREFSRRGPTARPLTKWLLENAESLRKVMGEHDREQAITGTVGYFEGRNAEYAKAVRDYFDLKLEADDTECKLAACCVLFDLDRESVAEQAAILEYDAGMTRTAAAMRAVWYALRDQQPDISEITALSAFDCHDQKQEWNCVVTADIPRPPFKRVPA